MLLLLGSANRDETVFADPDTLDPQRENARAPPRVRPRHPLLPRRVAGAARGAGPCSRSSRAAPGPAHGAAGARVHAQHDVPRPACPAKPSGSSRSRMRDDVTRGRRQGRGLGALIEAGLPVPGGFAIPVGTQRRSDERDPRRLRDARRATSRSRCARAPPPRTPPTRASRASTTPTSGSSARTRCSTPCAAAGRAWTRARGRLPAPTAASPARGMAVVVQRMVDADAAGVAMTLNPSNGDRCVVAIESAFGLGETVVGGTVTPDRFLVDKVMLEVVETRSPTSTSSSGPTGCATSSRDAARARRPSLTPDQVRASPRWPSAPSSTTAARRTSNGPSRRRGPPAAVPPGDRLGATSPSRGPAVQGGLLGIVDTLVNPLASRRSPNVRTGD